MMRKLLIAALVLTCGTSMAWAQAEGEKQRPPTQPLRGAPGEPVNVLLELTIIDQAGAAEPVRKTVTMLMADQTDSRIRSQGHMAAGQGPDQEITQVALNADAHVRVVAPQRLFVQATVEFSGPDFSTEDRRIRFTPLNQSFEVILESGKPTVVSKTNDPISGRRVTLEATATIIR